MRVTWRTQTKTCQAFRKLHLSFSPGTTFLHHVPKWPVSKVLLICPKAKASSSTEVFCSTLLPPCLLGSHSHPSHLRGPPLSTGGHLGQLLCSNRKQCRLESRGVGVNELEISVGVLSSPLIHTRGHKPIHLRCLSPLSLLPRPLPSPPRSTPNDLWPAL